MKTLWQHCNVATMANGTYSIIEDAAIVFMVFIFGVLGYFPETQAALMVGVVWILMLVVAYLLWVKPAAGRAIEVAPELS